MICFYVHDISPGIFILICSDLGFFFTETTELLLDQQTIKAKKMLLSVSIIKSDLTTTSFKIYMYISYNFTHYRYIII